MFTGMIETRKPLLKLSPIQEEILVGTLLGDGHLETQNHGKTYRVKIEHSVKQTAYVEWLHTHFKEWVMTPPSVRTRIVDFKKKQGTYRLIGFQTISTGSLRFFAHQFYRDGRKTVPVQIGRWLTPRAIAVWYMDDGSITSNAHRTVLLNTQGFTERDIKRLQSALLKKWGMKTSVRQQKEGIQIYVGSESIETFISMILPHVIPSMRYKIPKIWLTQLPKK